MVSMEDPPVTIRFEGLGTGTELWGGTQANFMLRQPDQHAREVAVLLNDPAADLLAEDLGQEPTSEFRAQAARHVGELWLQRLIDKHQHIGSLIVLSRAALEADPEFRAGLRESLQG